MGEGASEGMGEERGPSSDDIGGAPTAETTPVRPPVRPPVRAEQRWAEGLSYEESELRARQLIRSIGEHCPGADDAIQERLGRLVVLADGLRLPEERALLFEEADLALAQLAMTPPNLVLFDRIMTELRGRVGGPRRQRLFRFVMSAAPHAIVAAGAVLAMLLTLFLTQVLLPLIPRTDLQTLQLVTEAGCVGALTSLMLRFHRIRVQWRVTNRDAFFEGLFRPFIGVFFAWMVYSLFEAQLVPLRPITDASTTSLYVSMAFVTGFSERLGASLIVGVGSRTGSAGGVQTRGPG